MFSNASGEYVVWSSEHAAWWGWNRCGYTTLLDRAGRYSWAEAIAICKGARGGRQYNDNPTEVPLLYDDAAAFWPDDLPEWQAKRRQSQRQREADALRELGHEVDEDE